jgi:hypothetical protein
MKCPKCKGERIEAQHAGLQSMMDVCEYDLTCLDCGYAWRDERGLRVYSADEQKEWANVTFAERKVYGTPVLVSVIEEIRNAKEKP